ncbi:hypothetical protein N1851_028842 [Merluccius polli]|uniref:HAT C-terminal dimerisation domain-containing protein n=1 Tax=Merluccius polli TaxID=89951 RepID=A0AA47NR72_MERPO|nr:hypothetical protein N1851_028842 [Merluccius polli]
MYENPRVEVSPPPQPKSALEELFAEQEQERRNIHMNNSNNNNSSIQQRVREEIQLYRSLPMISMAEDPVLWWWTKRVTLPC